MIGGVVAEPSMSRYLVALGVPVTWRRAVVRALGLALFIIAVTPAVSVAAPALQLPYAQGASWWANGPHSSDGSTGARNSVDLGPGGSSPATVLAAAGGVARVESCNGGKYVTIDHGGGWSTRYWHLGSVPAGLNGSTVTPGSVIGTTALVCDNPTAFSHVHFGLFLNGVATPLDGVSMGGYTIRAGVNQYSGSWTRNSDGATVHTTGADGLARCCVTNNQSTSPPLPPAMSIVQWDGDTNAQRASWLVGRDNRRRWVRDVRTYNCLRARGIVDRGPQPAAVLNRIPDLNGVWAQCPPGDANYDGTVNIIDLSIMGSQWQRSGGLTADANYDGTVNIIDLSILGTNYGTWWP